MWIWRLQFPLATVEIAQLAVFGTWRWDNPSKRAFFSKYLYYLKSFKVNTSDLDSKSTGNVRYLFLKHRGTCRDAILGPDFSMGVASSTLGGVRGIIKLLYMVDLLNRNWQRREGCFTYTDGWSDLVTDHFLLWTNNMWRCFVALLDIPSLSVKCPRGPRVDIAMDDILTTKSGFSLV